MLKVKLSCFFYRSLFYIPDFLNCFTILILVISRSFLSFALILLLQFLYYYFLVKKRLLLDSFADMHAVQRGKNRKYGNATVCFIDESCIIGGNGDEWTKAIEDIVRGYGLKFIRAGIEDVFDIKLGELDQIEYTFRGILFVFLTF